MRVSNQGAYFRVTVNSREVYDFARRWPCAGFSDRGFSFVFNTLSGDMVDYSDVHPSADGSAVAALADDAREYGRKRLRLA